MYARPTILLPLMLLAVLAMLTFWIDYSVQAPEPKVDGSSRHDPDYILNNFITTRTDEKGDLRYRLTAAEMRHYPDNDTTELEQPHFTRFEIGKPFTLIEGQKGFVSSNGEKIEFHDDVKVVRQAYNGKGEMVVLTDRLDVLPDEEKASTDRPVVITQEPKTVIHATGMIYDKKNQTVQLLNRVKAHYEKPDVDASSTPNNLNRRPADAMQLETDMNSVARQIERNVRPAGAVQPEIKLNLSKDID
ncbi:MAG: LPS export ABC transporter periplasmic protein LptC [Betaproteobacteria bacterium HGW-Betaproteobacteria-8]|nr:MAG: LPS export ABC transporter periplasmic protein LptC [Betaproteobacteria bacterium HGW-Betaproteobacteria-8]